MSVCRYCGGNAPPQVLDSTANSIAFSFVADSVGTNGGFVALYDVGKNNNEG